MNKYILPTVCVLLVGVSTFFAYRSIAADAAYQQTHLQLNRIYQTIFTAPIARYGTVVSVDSSNNTLTIQTSNIYSGGSDTRLVLIIDANTLIGRQELTRSGEVYTGLSPLTSLTFGDIPVGARVKCLVLKRDGVLYATSVLVGNPL